MGEEGPSHACARMEAKQRQVLSARGVDMLVAGNGDVRVEKRTLEKRTLRQGQWQALGKLRVAWELLVVASLRGRLVPWLTLRRMWCKDARRKTWETCRKGGGVQSGTRQVESKAVHGRSARRSA